MEFDNYDDSDLDDDITPESNPIEAEPLRGIGPVIDTQTKISESR
jgi:hypothetical protein